MIYALLFWEFFKIGLLAVGGGLVTVPFLYELAESYHWFGSDELANMIAVSESTPGPLGVNMATYAGFKAAGIGGGVSATLGLIMPSLLIIIFLARYLQKHQHNPRLENILNFIRPAVLALICSAGWLIAKAAVTDCGYAAAALVCLVLIHFVKRSPVFYIILGAAGGLLLA